jgi:hypothetical protein
MRQQSTPHPQPADVRGTTQGIYPEASGSSFTSPRGEFRTIDAELVWIRYEGTSVTGSTPKNEPLAMTLSVCLIISWPAAALVNRSVDFAGAAETLRAIIQAFDHLRSQPTVIDSRSRIEDGQFVGWLSYPSVVQAEAGFHAVRDELAIHELGVSLRTRDEQVPIDWLER